MQPAETHFENGVWILIVVKTERVRESRKGFSGDYQHAIAAFRRCGRLI